MKAFLNKILPPFIKSILKKIRHFYFSTTPFNHGRAQEYELNSSIHWMQNEKTFEDTYEKFLKLKTEGPSSDSAHALEIVAEFFDGNNANYNSFLDTVKEKTCLEIGSGPVGTLSLMPWIEKRIVIDPLLSEYKAKQLDLFGKTLWTDDVQLYSVAAETSIPELKGKIDGCIIIRNALDHCKDPWQVMDRMAEYAAPGCTVLLWTDLWHYYGLDEGHRNITKSREEFEKYLKKINFKIDHSFSGVRSDGSTLEYGCVATKLP